ncbi:MAG: hypothetical protein WA618_15910 [Terriglobales bacterium]
MYNSFYDDDACGNLVDGGSTDVAPAAGSYLVNNGSISILAWKSAADGTIWWLDPTTLPGLAP